jgi:hypothetical protein
MESCTVETVMTVDGNMVTCDVERCTTTALVRTRFSQGGVVGPKGWTTVVNDTGHDETHFCPDHPQRFYG